MNRNHTGVDMSRRSIIFALMLFALYVFAAPRIPVHGQEYGLSMSVNCPSKAYAGESFYCQVTINNDDNASHDYALLWIIDGPYNKTPGFKTSGTIGPEETIDTGSSFTFSNAEDAYLSYIMNYNDHRISITLTQDGQNVTTEDFDVDIISVDLSLIPTITPAPVSPGSSFSLGLIIWNEGTEAINVTVRVYEVRGKITLESGVVADYGQIVANSYRTQTFNFLVDSTTGLGEYAIKVAVSYVDTRGSTYWRNYYVPVSISSAVTADELNLFESTTENKIDGLRSDLNAMSTTFTMFASVILAVSVCLALANYWFCRRVAHSRRTKP